MQSSLNSINSEDSVDSEDSVNSVNFVNSVYSVNSVKVVYSVGSPPSLMIFFQEVVFPNKWVTFIKGFPYTFPHITILLRGERVMNEQPLLLNLYLYVQCQWPFNSPRR